MREIKMYRKPGEPAAIPLFLNAVGDKLMMKIVQQILCVANTPPAMWREPHIKHFSIEKYSRFFEVREKSKILVRVIFTVHGEDILLLAPFVKRQKRDTMRALEQSVRMLADIREHPDYAVKFMVLEGSK